MHPNIAKRREIRVFVIFSSIRVLVQYNSTKIAKKMFSRKENGLGLQRLLVAPPLKKSKYGTRSSKTRDIDAEDAVP